MRSTASFREVRPHRLAMRPRTAFDRASPGGLSVFPGNHLNLRQRRPQRLVHGDAPGARQLVDTAAAGGLQPRGRLSADSVQIPHPAGLGLPRLAGLGHQGIVVVPVVPLGREDAGSRKGGHQRTDAVGHRWSRNLGVRSGSTSYIPWRLSFPCQATNLPATFYGMLSMGLLETVRSYAGFRLGVILSILLEDFSIFPKVNFSHAS